MACALLQREVYTSIHEAERELYEASYQQGFIVHRLRSKKSKKGVVRKVWYVCVHSRDLVKPTRESVNHVRHRQYTTGRMDCPWRAVAQLTYGLWKIIVSSDTHNHEMVQEMSAFHEARVLNNDQKKMVCDFRYKYLVSTIDIVLIDSFLSFLGIFSNLNV